MARSQGRQGGDGAGCQDYTPRIERIYTLDAAAELLGLKPRAFRRLIAKVKPPRRMMPNVPHSHKRVFTSSDVQALSAYRIAQYTALGHKNLPRVKRAS